MRNLFLVAALGLCQLYILRITSAKAVSCEKWKYTYFKKVFILSSSFHSQWVFSKYLFASGKRSRRLLKIIRESTDEGVAKYCSSKQQYEEIGRKQKKLKHT